MSRYESVRIASILPMYVCMLCHVLLLLLLYIYICVSQEQSFDISTPRYVYLFTIGKSSSLHLQLKFIGFTSSSFQTTTYCAFLAVRRHPPFFLEYSSTFSIICSCDPSGVSDIPTKSSADINPDMVSSPTTTVAPCLAALTATIRSLIYILNMGGGVLDRRYILCIRSHAWP